MKTLILGAAAVALTTLAAGAASAAQPNRYDNGYHGNGYGYGRYEQSFRHDRDHDGVPDRYDRYDNRRDHRHHGWDRRHDRRDDHRRWR